MKKLLQYLALALAVGVPTAALAAKAVSSHSGHHCCKHCPPGCPLCP